MAQSVFRGVIEFFGELGVYDIILPFLLIFTLVFAILEKTKILGIEKVDGKDSTKKNLNAMVAFVIAFLVIASTQLVAVINQVMANAVLLLILGVCFLMLVGVFFKDQEFSLDKYPTWTKLFMVLMFIGIVIIFLNALDWLKYIFTLFKYWNATWAASIFFIIILAAFMYFIIDPKEQAKPKEEKK